MLLDGKTQDDATDKTDADAEREIREGAAAPEPEIPPAPEPGKPVSIAAPLSRRARAEEERKAELKALTEGLSSMKDVLAQRDRQMGELMGHVQALSQRPQYAPPPPHQQPAAPQMPDPQELSKRAKERLDAKDFDGYHELTLQAARAATMREIAPYLQQQRQAPVQQQETISPQLMMYFSAYPDVAAHPNAVQLLAAKNVEMDAHGVPKSPERVRMIFDAVKADIMARRPTAAPQFSQQSAAVLSGVPTARPTNGSGQKQGGEPRVDLTAEERFWAKKAGIPEERIARNIAQSHPERVTR